MHIYLYIYIYIHIYKYIHIYIHICIYICICIYLRLALAHAGDEKRDDAVHCRTFAQQTQALGYTTSENKPLAMMRQHQH